MFTQSQKTQIAQSLGLPDGSDAAINEHLRGMNAESQNAALGNAQSEEVRNLLDQLFMNGGL